MKIVELDNDAMMLVELNSKENKTATLRAYMPGDKGKINIPKKVDFDGIGECTITEIDTGAFAAVGCNID